MPKYTKETALFDTGVIASLKETTDNTASYFWYKDGASPEAGAHVTEVPRASFESAPNGGNILMRSNSIKIRNALTVLASFTGDGMKVYKNGSEVASFGEEAVLTGSYGGTTYTTTFKQGRVQTGSSTYRYGSQMEASGNMWIEAGQNMYISAPALSINSRGLPAIDIITGEVDNLTVNGSDDQTITFSVAQCNIPDEYTPLGVVQFNVSNASSSGTGSSKIWVRGAYINSSGRPCIKVVNSSSSNAKILVTIEVLCSSLV